MKPQARLITRMREWLNAGVVATMLSTVASSYALEKVAIPAPEEEPAWSAAAAEVTVRYYNTCMGLAWYWPMSTGSRLGVSFDCPGPGSYTLVASTLFFDEVQPSYGYTGSLTVYASDATSCPFGPPLASVPFVPNDGFVINSWSTPVPSSFVLAVTVGTGWGNLPRCVTDHPGHGSSGPAPCGTCYPSTRPTHSFFYGDGVDFLCPGIPFFDGVCNAELIWSVRVSTNTVTSTDELTESKAWSGIKSLYR